MSFSLPGKTIRCPNPYGGYSCANALPSLQKLCRDENAPFANYHAIEFADPPQSFYGNHYFQFHPIIRRDWCKINALRDAGNSIELDQKMYGNN